MTGWLARLLGLFKRAPRGRPADDAWAAYHAGHYGRALSLARPAAESGDPSAQSLLGHLFDEGRGVKPDGAEGMAWFRLAAEGGEPYAQFMLGRESERWSDFAAAAKWYSKAARSGHAASRFKLGLFLRKGQGLDRDYVEAFKWLLLAAGQGDVDAAKELEDLRPLLSPGQRTEAERRAAQP